MTRLHHRHLVRTHFFDNVGIWIIRLIPIIAIVAFIWAQKNLVLTKEYIYTAMDLPKSFVGYKVMHVSDIANSTNDIANIARNEKPDVIVITGGYSDNNGNANNSIKTVEKLNSIAPVYYIYNTDDEQHVLDGTSAKNITNLSVELSPKSLDELTFIKNNYDDDIIKKYNKGDKKATQYVKYIIEALNKTKNSTIILCGLDLYNGKNDAMAARQKTFELIGTDPKKLTMLLNGNKDLIEEICRYTNTDMMFVGGTLGANGNIGLLDKIYGSTNRITKGVYGNRGTEVFVSGGVGTRHGSNRIMNFPEVSVITLSDGTIKDTNPLEKFISKFIPDVGTIFDNDGGFKKYTYKYNNESLDKELDSKSNNKNNNLENIIKR